jgi:hypothetical protein
MLLEGSASLELHFAVDSSLAVLILIFFGGIPFVGAAARLFMLLILSAVKFFWIWFLSVPSYVIFRSQNPQSHWTLDGFWLLRTAECVIWGFTAIGSLAGLRFESLLVSLIGLAISGLVSWYALRFLKLSSENRFARTQMPLL